MSRTSVRLEAAAGKAKRLLYGNCGDEACGDCVACLLCAARASLQREEREAEDEIARLTRELEAAREREREAARSAYEEGWRDRDDRRDQFRRDGRSRVDFMAIEVALRYDWDHSDSRMSYAATPPQEASEP